MRVRIRIWRKWRQGHEENSVHSVRSLKKGAEKAGTKSIDCLLKMARIFCYFQTPFTQIRQSCQEFLKYLFQESDATGLGLFRILFGKTVRESIKKYTLKFSIRESIKKYTLKFSILRLLYVSGRFPRTRTGRCGYTIRKSESLLLPFVSVGESCLCPGRLCTLFVNVDR